jgi:hypothetical protein
LVNEDRYETVKYDCRLDLSLDFVCKTLGVSREDFASLAISNLLDEELDFIKSNGFNADLREIKMHQEMVNTVKYEANGWVINRE